MEFNGATGHTAFDDKGDRKDAEMSIFRVTEGKLIPIAIIKKGQTLAYADFLSQANPAATPGANDTNNSGGPAKAQTAPAPSPAGTSK